MISSEVDKYQILRTKFAGRKKNIENYISSKREFLKQKELNIIFGIVCEYGFLDYAKTLVSKRPDIDISSNKEYAFNKACQQGYLDVVRWLYLIKPDLNIDDKIFGIVCGNGYFDLAIWLYKIKPDIDISANNEYAFRMACLRGMIDTVNWFLKIKPNLDISANNEEAFRNACNNGHLDLAKLLISKKKILIFLPVIMKSSEMHVDLIS